MNVVTDGGNGGYNYLWSNGQTTQNLVDVGAGSYTCVVTDSKNCSKLIGPFVVENASGLDESKYLNQFIFPNPVSNLLDISV
ncbi:MAG: hypothetical protein IPO92_03810 [Saprospiraceae bacterium]|nr:hypothetical protein [Saprospiraceae bacterium]